MELGASETWKLTLTNVSHEGIFYLLRLWVNKLYIYRNAIVSYAWLKYDKSYIHKLTVTNASHEGSVWVTETPRVRGHDVSKFVASIYPRWRVHDMQKVMHDRWPILSCMNWAVWIKRWGLLKQHEPMAALKGTFNSWTQPVKNWTWEGNPTLYRAVCWRLFGTGTGVLLRQIRGGSLACMRTSPRDWRAAGQRRQLRSLLGVHCPFHLVVAW